MKRILKYLLPLCGAALVSCYGLEKEDYRELAPITVSGLDRTIYTRATEKLHLDRLRVESPGRELQYEWAYGKPYGDFPGMADTTFLSHSPTLDHVFNNAGSYVLRLKVDNGESIGFHYYDLRVQAGFDEGFLILCNDDEGAGSLAFVKKRSPAEEAEGAQEVWDNLLTINPEYDFRDLRDVYVFSSPSRSGILITSGDDEGSVYRIDPVSLEVNYAMKGMDEYGTKTGAILGEKTAGTSHYCYLIGDDGHIYRYELSADMLIYRRTPYPVKYGYQGYGYYPGTGSASGIREPLLFSESAVVRFPGSNIIGFEVPGYEIVNFAGTRLGSEVYYGVTRALEGSPKQVRIISTRGSGATFSEEYTYNETKPMLMDRNSRLLPTKLNDNIYYNYGNAIYHWSVKSVNPSVPAEGDKADITLPAGERIMDICTNAVPSTTDQVIDDDRLIVATYNPDAKGRKPGSLFIYDLRTMEKRKEYVGICEKPVAIAYKFPTSN